MKLMAEFQPMLRRVFDFANIRHGRGTRWQHVQRQRCEASYPLKDIVEIVCDTAGDAGRVFEPLSNSSLLDDGTEPQSRAQHFRVRQR